MESQSQFSLHLDGNSEIDAILLSDIIKDMALLAKITGTEINPDAYLKMNVTAFRNGSFQIDFSALCDATQTLLDLTCKAVPVAAGIVASIKGYFEIKKLLKGSVAKSVNELPDDTVEVENTDGEKVYVPKASAQIINNVTIDQLTVNISNSVLEHNPSGGFTFSDESSSSHYNTADVRNISKSIPIQEQSICQRYTVDTILPIRKAVLVGYSKWGFTYNGKAIDAHITDDAFIQRVQNGETIRTGDSIKATLEIYITMDILGNPVPGSEKYSILKVHGPILHDAEQMTLSGV